MTGGVASTTTFGRDLGPGASRSCNYVFTTHALERLVEQPELELLAQHPHDRAVDERHVDPALADPLHERRGERVTGRQLQVDPCRERLHGRLAELMSRYDVNDFAASVQVYALKA